MHRDGREYPGEGERPLTLSLRALRSALRLEKRTQPTIWGAAIADIYMLSLPRTLYPVPPCPESNNPPGLPRTVPLLPLPSTSSLTCPQALLQPLVLLIVAKASQDANRPPHLPVAGQKSRPVASAILEGAPIILLYG